MSLNEAGHTQRHSHAMVLKEHSAVSGLNYMIDLFQVVTDFSSFMYKFIIFN